MRQKMPCRGKQGENKGSGHSLRPRPGGLRAATLQSSFGCFVGSGFCREKMQALSASWTGSPSPAGHRQVPLPSCRLLAGALGKALQSCSVTPEGTRALVFPGRRADSVRAETVQCIRASGCSPVCSGAYKDAVGWLHSHFLWQFFHVLLLG